MIATGIGSWPGADLPAAYRQLIDVVSSNVPSAGVLPSVAEPSDQVPRWVDRVSDSADSRPPFVPYLIELPTRGPGADLIGRGAALLVDLPVDLQPSGWRLVPRPGRDLARAQSWLQSDDDVLAEVFDGYSGPLKIQLTGPWTLAAHLQLTRLELAAADAGACRDLVASLAQGASDYVAAIRRAVPAAQLVVQIDEPSLPAVLGGRLPTASGRGRVRAIAEPVLVQGLADVVAAARRAVGAGAPLTTVTHPHTRSAVPSSHKAPSRRGDRHPYDDASLTAAPPDVAQSIPAERVAIHCCARDVPVAALARSGADALSFDVTGLPMSTWETLAAAVESGIRLWAGVVPTVPAGLDAALDQLTQPWRALGLPEDQLTQVVITPTCGLAGLLPEQARRATAQSVEAAASVS